MDADVPLVVPEVNGDTLAGYMARNGRRNIVANPNCSTIQLVVALKPLHDAARIRRASVATYQSVSGAGKAGMDELFEQTRNIYAGGGADKGTFTKQIAFNVIPHIDVFMEGRLDEGGMEDGQRDEEDSRPGHRHDRDLRARAGLHRPCRGGAS